MTEPKAVKRARKPKSKDGDEYCVRFDKDIALVQRKEGYEKRLADKKDKDLTVPEWACVPLERSQAALLAFGNGYTQRGEEFITCSSRTLAVVLFTLLHPEMVHGNGFNALWLLVAGRKLTTNRGKKTLQSLKYRITQQTKLNSTHANYLNEDDAELLRYAWGAPYAKPGRSGSVETRYNESETNRAYECVQWVLKVQWDKLDKSKRKPQQTTLRYKKVDESKDESTVPQPTAEQEPETAACLEETPENMGRSFRKLQIRIESFILPSEKRARDAVLKSDNLTLAGRERLVSIIEGLDYKAATERMNRLTK